jgi:OmpA-OmpF porin, OOP family
MDAELTQTTEREDGGSRAIGMLATGGFTALLLWALLQPGWLKPGEAAPLAPPLPGAPQPAAAAPAQPGADVAARLGPMVQRALPGGLQITVPERGVEGRLLAFIDDPARAVDRDTWFEFDRLTFETGSAVLGPSSRDQLQAVAEILKTHPRLRLKIGGYTDDVGAPALNLRLSEARAAGVRAGIIALGVAPERLESEGYGEQHPVADNATPQGRARNRRIAMRVLEK